MAVGGIVCLAAAHDGGGADEALEESTFDETKLSIMLMSLWKLSGQNQVVEKRVVDRRWLHLGRLQPLGSGCCGNLNFWSRMLMCSVCFWGGKGMLEEMRGGSRKGVNTRKSSGGEDATKVWEKRKGEGEVDEVPCVVWKLEADDPL